MIGEAHVEAAGDRRGEFVVDACNAMNNGMGELVDADVAEPRRGTESISASLIMPIWPGKNALT